MNAKNTIDKKKKYGKKLKGPRFNKGTKGSRSNTKKKWIEKESVANKDKPEESIQYKYEPKVGVQNTKIIKETIPDSVSPKSSEQTQNTSSCLEDDSIIEDSSSQDDKAPLLSPENPPFNIIPHPGGLIVSNFSNRMESLSPMGESSFKIRWPLIILYLLSCIAFYCLHVVFVGPINVTFLYHIIIFCVTLAMGLSPILYYFGITYSDGKDNKFKQYITYIGNIAGPSVDERTDSQRRVDLKHPNPHISLYRMTYDKFFKFDPRYHIDGDFKISKFLYAGESETLDIKQWDEDYYLDLHVSRELFAQIKHNRHLTLNTSLDKLFEKLNYALDNINTVNLSRYYSHDVVTDTALFAFYYAINMRQKRESVPFRISPRVIE